MKGIVAVIVAYHPPPDFPERVQAVAEEAERVIIVDNAPPQDYAHMERMQRVEYIRNAHNLGVGAALNQGIRLALAAQAQWVLLLDHDSVPVPGMAAAMLEALAEYADPERIALIAPDIVECGVDAPTSYLVAEGFRFRRVPAQQAHDTALMVITSGSLVRADALRELGPMAAHFFIDYIDHEFCLRMRAHGWRILIAPQARLRHRLGEKTAHSMLGARIVASHHGASRRFTIFRNRVWLWKRYGAAFPGFLAHDMLAACFDLLRIVCYETDKAEKLAACLRGVAAGLRREPANSDRSFAEENL